MILHENFAFVHVPKTAGTTLHNFFEKRHGLKCYRELHGSYIDIPLESRNTFVFGFMRNPLHQEVSLWKYHSHFWAGEAKKDPISFEDWCRWKWEEAQDWARKWLNEGHVDYGWGFNYRPQAGYFCDEQGICQATKIYRFEELLPSLAEISQRIGLDVNTHGESKALDGSNGMTYQWSRGKLNYDELITPKAEAILREHKAIDFRLWETDGDISIDYECPTVANYAYAR
jgi:hypothetical protein